MLRSLVGSEMCIRDSNLDIKELYPTITKKVLNEAFDFAKLHTATSDKELQTIYHCRKSLLFLNNVHTSSNYPPQIVKQLPVAIADRLSKNSSNQTIFENAKTEYEDALKKSVYKNVNLKFSKPKTSKKKRNRTRNIIWFNPPYSRNFQ